MELFYRKYGNEGDKPLIILHGLFGISDNWVTFARRMAMEGFEVFVPDMRNHGRSPHSDVFNYLALTDDLFEFIDDHGINNPMIIGHSMGGKVAMRFALENPQLVERLVVVDIGLKAYPPRRAHLQIINAMKSVDISKTAKRSEIERQLEKHISEKRIRLFIMKNLHRNGDNGFEWRININGIEHNLENLLDAIDTDTVFDKPTLFIKGGKSDYILHEDFPQLRKNFPNAEIVTIAGTSHWVHVEAPEVFYQLAMGFLTGKPDWLTDDKSVKKAE